MEEPTNTLLATYRDPDSAREAIAALERHGIDAERIRLLDAPETDIPKTGRAERELDHDMTKGVARRSFGGAILMALVLGAIGALTASLLSGDITAVLLCAAGGAMAGGGLGFVLGGFSGLAVSEEWSDTFETTGETTVVIDVTDQQVIDLRDTIDHTRPERVILH